MPRSEKLSWSQRMIFVDDGPGGSALLHGLYGDSRSVLIAAADENYVAPLRPQIPRARVSAGGDRPPARYPICFSPLA